MNSESHSTKYFFDSYALIEIFLGNKAYEKYLSSSFFLTALNLFEYHHYLIKRKGQEFADREINKFSPHLREFGIATVRKASSMKHRNNKRNLSMADCIGYVFAIENGLIFLTGDKEFKNLEKVELIQ